MSVETMSRRISVIEQTWKDASQVGRDGYVEELSEISTGLGHVTGPEAERAQWLTRRLNRVVRNIGTASEPDRLAVRSLTERIREALADVTLQAERPEADQFVGEQLDTLGRAPGAVCAFAGDIHPGRTL